MRKLFTILFIFTSAISFGQAFQDITPQIGANWWDTKPAIISLPDEYADSVNKKYPIIIFLHGSGEGSSTRNDALLKSTGLPYKIDNGQVPKAISPVDGRLYKFIVICPQFDAGATLGQFGHSDNWTYFLNWIKSHYRIDQQRVYTTGLSLGAEGAHDACVWNPSFAQGIAATYLVAFTGNPTLNQPPDFDSTASMGKRYGVGLRMIYGSLDTAGTGTDAADHSWNLVNKYNSTSPYPLGTIFRIAGATHSSSTWNVAYDTATKYSGMNMYEWLLTYQSEPPIDPNAGELKGSKIPITTKYVWQDNSQQDRADKLVDNDTTVNYSPARPIIYSQHEVVFDLWEFYPRVTGVKVWIANSDTCTVKVIMVRRDNNAETVLGTFSGGANQHFVYQSTDSNNIMSKIILRTSSSNYQLGSEVEVWGYYTNPRTTTQKGKRPLSMLAGTVAHSYDLMNDAKLNKLKTLGLTNIRVWENAYDVTNSANAFKFEPELGTDRYSTDSAFGILKRWNPNLYTWKASTGQWTKQKDTWSVIDNFPNRYIKGVDSIYINHGSWGEVWMRITQVAQPTEYNITLWYVYKNGSLINVTETPETFSSSLVGQMRHYNVGGGLSISSGDTLYFYKSQASVNPVYFSANDLPKRNLDSSYQLNGYNAFVYASRGGRNVSVPSYTLQTTSPTQRLLKGYGIYNAVEPANEPDAWWTSWLGFWNGKTISHLMNLAYDGNKLTYSNSGAKQADSTIDVILSGMATDKVDQIYGAIEESRFTRGYLSDSSINVPFNTINMHIYPSAGGQYGSSQGGLSWEAGARPQVQMLVDLLQRRAQHCNLMISEWGWDINSGSPLHAGMFGGYDRESVAGFWMARALVCMAVDGVDRSTYYTLFQDWPESSSNTDATQFKTMRLLRQPVDANADSIVRSRQGDYMAQLMNCMGNYYFFDSVATPHPYVHAYRFAYKDSLKIVVWSEESFVASGDTLSFTDRTGNIDLSITGSYNLRQFLDDGSATMSSSSGSAGGTLTITYAAKPKIIEVTTKRRGIF